MSPCKQKVLIGPFCVVTAVCREDMSSQGLWSLASVLAPWKTIRCLSMQSALQGKV